MLSMALLRKFLVELIVVAIIVGWAVAKFPNVVTPWIPWLCLVVVWHLIWELSRGGVVTRWLRKRRTGMDYLIAFIIGGAASAAVPWGIRTGVEKLGVMEEHREHPEVATDVQLSITCDNVALPMAYHGDLWVLNTVILKGGGGLLKYMPPPNKPEGLWPEEGVNGFGYRCTVKNHGTQAAFSVSFPVTIRVLNIIRTGSTWTTGEAKETHTATVRVPQPLGQQGSDQFSFYVCSYDPDGPLNVTLPSTGFINSDEPKYEREVSVKVTSMSGNPFTVPPKQLKEAPKISPAPRKPSEPAAPTQTAQPDPESKPEITADFVQGTSPGLLFLNKSAAVIRDPIASYGMWNLSKNPPLMIPTWEVRESGAFIKTNTGRIVATADTPQAKPYISEADKIFALIIVDCPECKSSRIYYLYFVYGQPQNSWFSEVPEGGTSNVLLVNNLMQRSGWDPEKFLAMVPHSPKRSLEPPTGIVTQP